VPTTTIAAENLDKSFSGTPLFSGLSFSASRGLVAVSGRNGSGKTTLLKILAGLARPTSGRVHIETEGAAALTPSERRLAVGWAGPDLELYGELSAVENLHFFRKAAGREADTADLVRRLAAVGLAEEAMRRRVEEYSTGMNLSPGKRVARPWPMIDASASMSAFFSDANARKPGVPIDENALYSWLMPSHSFV
jgi:ABC-type multidrug transport system ATPase subunit